MDEKSLRPEFFNFNKIMAFFRNSATGDYQAVFFKYEDSFENLEIGDQVVIKKDFKGPISDFVTFITYGQVVEKLGFLNSNECLKSFSHFLSALASWRFSDQEYSFGRWLLDSERESAMFFNISFSRLSGKICETEEAIYKGMFEKMKEEILN